jgi:hypothetical protein
MTARHIGGADWQKLIYFKRTVEAVEDVGCKARGRPTSAIEVWVFAG